MANKQKETMEEIPDELPKIVNNELNEEAEYRGAKQNEEDLLLTAQRYLNIFHQIHIFKEKKKEKFHKSLLKNKKSYALFSRWTFPVRIH